MERPEIVRLRERIEDYYKAPGQIPIERKRIAKKLWHVRVYQRWAAEEFLETVKNAPDILYAAEEFAKMMDEFACKDHDTDVFSIAYDVAVDLSTFLMEV